ncbi:amidase domain-containing protein [Neobacillus sp. YIM B06451]|uniref:amidase domain-containing protein n=1 Tax=Neobacillus sp. YIM B06451 TaxID=3070994 RepID=UPI002930EA0A|nr:amidase domain-containing protein [Neobacillus sp. YIM B06451]
MKIFSKISLCALTVFLTIASTIVGATSEKSVTIVEATSEKSPTKSPKQNIEFKLHPTLGTDKVSAKNNALRAHKDAIAIVNKYYKEKDGIDLKVNLDDREYQNKVMMLGTAALDNLSEKEIKEIVKFIKFMDRYENYGKNEKINKLKEKNNQRQLTIDEERELEELLPIEIDQYTEETGSEVPTFSIAEVFANGYDQIAARDYARKWTSNTEILRNNAQFPYYSRVNGNCYSCWWDCTNFVSQALMAGGMRHLGYDQTWYYSNAGPSYSWGGANSFYKHWKNRAVVAGSYSDLRTGDVVSANYDTDADIDHNAMITRNDSTSASGKWLTQHTDDMEELTTVGTWVNRGYKIVGYEMDKAQN